MTTEQLEKAFRFYEDILGLINKSGIPFLLGGAFALKEYAGIIRDTKDLDLFCKPADYQAILHVVAEAGYTVEIKDPEWIAKIHQDEAYVDLIFSSRNRVCTVDQDWFDHSVPAHVINHDVRLMPPEEMIWTKIFVRERDRYDGADINHIINHHGHSLDWKRLLDRMGTHWEMLMATLIEFRFVYPTEVHKIPEWLFRECLLRLEQQLALPIPQDKICRGLLLAFTQYQIDIHERGYSV